jgi:membrane-bound ClpP family serine protease
MTKAVQTRRRPVAVGPQEIIGMQGVVRRGQVAVRGELWQARTAGGEPLVTGEEVVVESIDGLVLVVRPVGAPAPVA